LGESRGSAERALPGLTRLSVRDVLDVACSAVLIRPGAGFSNCVGSKIPPEWIAILLQLRIVRGRKPVIDPMEKVP
jgi:hypothetical protein